MCKHVMQSRDYDAEGIFIKKWVNELKNVPSNLIHEPWKIILLEKQLMNLWLNCPDRFLDLIDSTKK